MYSASHDVIIQPSQYLDYFFEITNVFGLYKYTLVINVLW